MAGNMSGPSGSKAANILLNHDFSGGLNSWRLNCCNGYVISAEAGSQGGILLESEHNYAVITDRKECWQGLEQDITDRVSMGSTYMVSAFVGVSGLSQGSADVLATLKLEYHDSATHYVFIGRYKKNCNFITSCFKEIEENSLTCVQLFSAELLLKKVAGKSWKEHFHCLLSRIGLYFISKDLLLELICL